MGAWDPQLQGVVRLPDGRLVRGTGLRRARGAAADPEFAVYLLGRDPRVAGWEYRWVRWPDFRGPHSGADAVATLRTAYDRAADERVEISCRGGVGRTGTALAVLAVLGGIAPGDAVAWVRERYHPRAVETPWQRRWVGRVGDYLS